MPDHFGLVRALLRPIRDLEDSKKERLRAICPRAARFLLVCPSRYLLADAGPSPGLTWSPVLHLRFGP